MRISWVGSTVGTLWGLFGVFFNTYPEFCTLVLIIQVIIVI